MADFYTRAQRDLQNRFETRDLADRLEEAIVTDALSDAQTDFVHARDMFFLSTLDDDGFPSASYKGGAPGFVRVLGPARLVFPSYDGNGMFLSMGNIAATSRVGLLFVDFTMPQRLRARGSARLLTDGPIVESYPGADLAVEVMIERVWQNCPRYVHRMTAVERSRYVPDENGRAKFAPWKRIDVMQDVLSETDRLEAARLGLVTTEEYDSLERAGRT